MTERTSMSNLTYLYLGMIKRSDSFWTKDKVKQRSRNL